MQIGIYLWKEDGSHSVKGKDFENKLNFLLMGNAWHVLYMGNESCDKDLDEGFDEDFDFDLTEEVKESSCEMIDNLLREQKLYMEYFKTLAQLNPQGVQESFYDLKALFERFHKTGVQMDKTQERVMNILKSPESQKDLEQLLNKLKNINRTKVNT